MSIWGAPIWGSLKSWIGLSQKITDPNSPDRKSPTVLSWQTNLALVRTIYAGWQALYEKRQAFLPQHPKEEAQDYEIRARRPTFYNAFARTVRALAGAPFAEDPTPEGVPDEILTLYKDDIDNEGTSGPMFVRHCFQDALTTGLAGIFVNMPALEVPEGVPATRLTELEAGLRPYWKLVRMDDIVSFRTVVENGKVILSQLVLIENSHQPEGEYGVKEIVSLRVYRRLLGDTNTPIVMWELFQKGQRAEWESRGTGIVPIVTEIPLAQIYTERVGFMDANPPLLDLASVNLLHYQMSSDLHHAAHIANVPFLFGVGFSPQELQIGPNRAVVVESGDTNTTLRWVETTGASLGSTRAILSDLEEQMSHLGLGMLQRKSRAAETAQKAQLDRKDQESTLGAAVSNLENGLEQALYFTALYLGLPEGGRFTFTRAFETAPVASAQVENQGGPTPPKPPTPPGVTNNPATSGA